MRKTKDTFWHFLHFRPQGDFFANKFQIFTYKVSFTRIALQEHQANTMQYVSLFVVHVVKIYDIVLVTLEYRCFALFSFASWSPQLFAHVGKCFFFRCFLSPRCFQENFSDVSLSLSLYITVKSSTYKPVSAVQIGAKFWEVRFSSRSQLCSFLSFETMMNTIFHCSPSRG